MFSPALIVSALLAFAPLADATLSHGSARFTRHNTRSRALFRRASNDTSSASTGSRCTKRSHPPQVTAVSLAASATATSSPAASATASAHSKSASAHNSKSAAPAASTPSSSSSSNVGGLLGQLFPVSTDSAWTTASGVGGVDVVGLSTSSLKITSQIKSIPNPISTFQGKTAIQAHFPQGEWGLEKSVTGGMSWYGAGQTTRQDWNNAKELTFGYSLFFTDNFGWNKGGKLPGLYFGQSESQARGCSGGNRDTQCASVRLMWRKDGEAEFYTYLPNPQISSKFNANKALCNVAPFSTCNDVYGASVGRGAFSYKAGQWNNVAMRVLVNDEGQANGEIELFFNGESKVTVTGLIIAAPGSTPVRPQGIMAQSFFGGSDSTWASPKDQSIYFSDFSVAITKTFN